MNANHNGPPEQHWICPEGCKYPECIHVARERVRLVCAIYEALERVAASARMVIAATGRRTQTQRERLRVALEDYDRAVAAHAEGP